MKNKGKVYIVPVYNNSYMKKLKILKKEQLLYIETGKQKVAEILCKYPEKEFTLSDLAKEASVRKSNIGNILGMFHSWGFVEITKLTKIWRIKANQTNWNFVRYKIVYNLSQIYQSEIVEYLVEYYHNPKSVILFGSFRKGEDISTSDIDLAVEIDEEKYEIIPNELSSFENYFGRKIQIHLFNRKKTDINLFNNIANGIILWGFLEVKP
jgi:predicted nucleotidyltransferase